MINAETRKHGEDSIISVKFSGDAPEILEELCHIIAKGAEVLPDLMKEENKEMGYEETLFDIIMTAMDTVRDEGREVDRKKLGLAMMMDEALMDFMKLT